MIEERYVNFEVAMLLRDKGFDEECTKLYNINNGKVFEVDEIHNSELSEFSDLITRPTQAMACDWVEETFNIAIVLDLTILGYEPVFLNGHKDPNIASNDVNQKDDMTVGDNSDGSWSSKELAYNEALKYVLTKLI